MDDTETLSDDPSMPTGGQKSTTSTSGQGDSPSEQEIQAWLVSNIAVMVEVEEQSLDIAEPLESYGMDSLQATALSGDLADWLGRELSPTVVWDYPTIELLARHLSEVIDR